MTVGFGGGVNMFGGGAEEGGVPWVGEGVVGIVKERKLLADVPELYIYLFRGRAAEEHLWRSGCCGWCRI